MCLIAYKNGKDAKFSEVQFRKMVNSNAHGLGIMFIENDRIQVHRTVGNEADKFALYNKFKDLPYYAMHARWKTHGEINIENCHPYKVLSIDDGDPVDMYMMHNGVISNAPDVDKKMSDTWNFVESIIKPIAKVNPDLIWENEGIQTLIDDFIGRGSKLLFMRNDLAIEDSVLLFNEDAGNYFNGSWLSNASCNITEYAGYGHNHHRHHSHRSWENEWTSPWWNKFKENTCALAVKGNAALDHEWDENTKKDDDTKKLLTTTVQTAMNNLKETRDHHSIILQCLKVLSDEELIKELQESPTLAADTIMYFYNKPNITRAALITEILDKDKVKDTVNLIRNLSDKIEEKAA